MLLSSNSMNYNTTVHFSKILREKYFLSIIVHLAKLSVKCKGGIKTFSNMQVLKKWIYLLFHSFSGSCWGMCHPKLGMWEMASDGEVRCIRAEWPASHLIRHGFHLLELGNELGYVTAEVLDFPSVMSHLLLVHPYREGRRTWTDWFVMLLSPSASTFASQPIKN